MALPSLKNAQVVTGSAASHSTTSFTYTTGDVVLIACIAEGSAVGHSFSLPTTTLSSQTITQRQLHASNSDPAGGLWSWTVTGAGGAGTVTVTQTNTSTDDFTLYHFVWGNAVEPTTARTFLSTGSGHTTNYTITGTDPAMAWFLGDWAAAATVASSPTDTTHNASTPGPQALRDAAVVTGKYTHYGMVLDDQTVSGATAYGIGGSGTGPFTIVGAEIQGSAAAPTGLSYAQPGQAWLHHFRHRQELPGVSVTAPTLDPLPAVSIIPARPRRFLPLRLRQRPAEPLPVQLVPVAPSYIRDPIPRRGIRSWAVRHRQPLVLPGQLPIPLESRRRVQRVPAGSTRRRPVTIVPSQDTSVPAAPRRLTRALLRRRGTRAEPVPPQQAATQPPPYVSDLRRRLARGFAVARHRLVTPVPPQQAAAQPPPYISDMRRILTRGFVPRRGRKAEPVPPQTAPLPEGRRRPFRGVATARHRQAQPVPPQAAAAQPPPYVSDMRRRLARGWAVARHRLVSPVPPQAAAAQAPPLVPDTRRRVARGIVTARHRAVSPVPPQQVPAAPPFVPETRRRPARGVSLRRGRQASVTHSQTAPHPTTRRRITRGFVPKRGKTVTPVPPQVIVPPPVKVHHPPRRGFKGMRRILRQLVAPVWPFAGRDIRIRLVAVHQRSFVATPHQRTLAATPHQRSSTATPHQRTLAATPHQRTMLGTDRSNDGYP